LASGASERRLGTDGVDTNGAAAKVMNLDRLDTYVHYIHYIITDVTLHYITSNHITLEYIPYIRTNTYTHIHTHTHTYAHIRTHTHIHTYTHTHMCTCIARSGHIISYHGIPDDA